VPELKGAEMKNWSTVVVMEYQFYFHACVDNPLFESPSPHKKILLSSIDD
jgi:hypothetical protein